MERDCSTPLDSSVEGPGGDTASFLEGLEHAQQRFCTEVGALVGRLPAGGLFSQMVALQLSLTVRLFAAQHGVLGVVAETEHEAAAIGAGASFASDDATEAWLDEVFPDLLIRDLSTRRRIESLSEELPVDASTLLELVTVLEDERAVRLSGRNEYDAMNRLLDELWCSARALRRAVVDDAHTRVVLADRIAALQSSVQVDAEVVTEASEVTAAPVSEMVESVAASLRVADPARLREVLGELLSSIHTPTPEPEGLLEPVTDEPLFRFDVEDWKLDAIVPQDLPEQRNFWPIETPVRRGRRPWITHRTPQLRVTS